MSIERLFSAAKFWARSMREGAEGLSMMKVDVKFILSLLCANRGNGGVVVRPFPGLVFFQLFIY